MTAIPFAFWRVWLWTLVPLVAGVVWLKATWDDLNSFVIWVGGTAMAIAWGATALGVVATWPDLIAAANHLRDREYERAPGAGLQPVRPACLGGLQTPARLCFREPDTITALSLLGSPGNTVELFYDPMGVFVAHPADDVPDGRVSHCLPAFSVGNASDPKDRASPKLDKG